MHSSIISAGMYLPVKRIKTAEIAEHWRQDPMTIRKGLGVEEKTVPDIGEDSYTLACEAGRQAIEMAGIQSSEISACFIGSESHPYAVKPTSGMVASALEIHPFSFCADLEFACKAGTAAMQIIDAFIRSKQINYGLAVGTDAAQAKPGDALEYTAAAGAAAFVLGSANAANALCQIDHTISFTTDTPDFWRPANEKHPSHAGRFTGEPSYFKHIRETLSGILEIAKKKPKDIDHVVLHMPNAKFPRKIAKEFGFTNDQMSLGMIVETIGNTYSACSPIGLAHVLQEAKKNETILLVSYGSGAGSDAFLMTMQRNGRKLPEDTRKVEYITYANYWQLAQRNG